MKLKTLRISNFQSFGLVPTAIDLTELSFIIGPNGAGKTAVLQALCRMFGFDANLRKIARSDFHVPHTETVVPEKREFWLEADFTFPELASSVGAHLTIPPHFSHMRLGDAAGVAMVRFRLTASIDAAGDIDDSFQYVYDLNPDGTPLNVAPVRHADRSYIQLHYLPAHRDPADHIAYGANALLGRLLRAMNWDAERANIAELTAQISEGLAQNAAVVSLSTVLAEVWKGVHKGAYFTDPAITFATSEIDALLRHLSVSFAPGHGEQLVDFSRLSDGQKSMLYLSLVLSAQAVGRKVLAGDVTFNGAKLKPAVFTIIAMEEPENSLSPHYLGRIVTALRKLVECGDAQALIATHAPSMLRRVEPEDIRYLRLNNMRQTQVREIVMPAKVDEANKFVREAVQAFPELYFSRLVVLGEGDSEEIVLPRILKAKGYPVDEHGICIAPLGGRHVNHFWRLLHGLDIPFVTLLDFDLARYQGGWGRIKYVMDKIQELSPPAMIAAINSLTVPPKWDDVTQPFATHYANYWSVLQGLRIFFSYQLDIDFSMLTTFPDAYDIAIDELTDPDASDCKAVLGKKMVGADQYSVEHKRFFIPYHKRFKLGSKPSAHLNALAKISDADLSTKAPTPLLQMVDAIVGILIGLPE